MKKISLSILLVGISLAAYAATPSLQSALPLLQKHQRTAEENQQVLSLFRTAKDPNLIFASGASLVKIPPQKNQEPALFSILMRQQDPLRQTFSAIILIAMGNKHEELAPTLENALTGKDPVLRAYTAAAYAFIRPENTNYTDEIVRLYIFDNDFAARALNVLNGTENTPLKTLKKAAVSADPQVRAAAASWLGNLHAQASAKQLLKMAKKETDSSAQAAIATALAAQREYTLQDVSKALSKNFNSPYANTCALALGFMTGNGLDAVRKNLMGNNINARINAARAAAYMANILSNPDAFSYSSDRVFDIHLLKGLIAPLKALETSGNKDEKTYAANALRQIEKLME